MTRSPRTARPAALHAALLAVLCTLLPGAAPLQAQDLPDAGALVARHHEAVGGTDALRARTSIRSTGQFAMPAAGVIAEFESMTARPNRTLMRVDIPGFGERRSGFVDGVAWTVNPSEGPRVMEGAEALQAADDADFDASFRLPGAIESMVTVERTALGGRECYKVRVLWKSGRESFDCYSTTSGLLLGSMHQHVTSMGTLDAIMLFEDYRSFDGLLMAARITVQAMGIEQTFTIRSIEFDRVPDTAFDPPAEVAALIRQ